ncbi:putative protein Patronus [Helianthus annuus]|nr:putative protein Patronus [Helianthus annuus]
MSQRKKAIAFAENEKFPYSIAEEGFNHNHDECIKQQTQSVGLSEFLSSLGFYEDACFQSVSPKEVKDESAMMIFEVEEILEPIFEDHRVHGGMMSPIFGSPGSPKLYDDDDFPSFAKTMS